MKEKEEKSSDLETLRVKKEKEEKEEKEQEQANEEKGFAKSLYGGGGDGALCTDLRVRGNIKDKDKDDKDEKKEEGWKYSGAFDERAMSMFSESTVHSTSTISAIDNATSNVNGASASGVKTVRKGKKVKEEKEIGRAHV